MLHAILNTLVSINTASDYEHLSDVPIDVWCHLVTLSIAFVRSVRGLCGTFTIMISEGRRAEHESSSWCEENQ